MSYRTVKAEPTNSTYLDTYAWILFEKGKFTEARIYIEQALKNGDEKPDQEYSFPYFFHIGHYILFFYFLKLNRMGIYEVFTLSK